MSGLDVAIECRSGLIDRIADLGTAAETGVRRLGDVVETLMK